MIVTPLNSSSFASVRYLIVSTVILISLLQNLCAQEVLWTYEVKGESPTYPSLSWLDDNENIYANITYPDKSSGSGSTYNSGYLLKISNSGTFGGVTYIRTCENKSTFFPFGKNRFLTYGNNCEKNLNGLRYDTRIFNQRGKLLSKGTTLPEHKSLTGYIDGTPIFFSRKLDFDDFSTLYLGSIDKRHQIQYDSIDVSSAKIDDYGISMVSNPVYIGNQWVLILNYLKHRERGLGRTPVFSGIVALGEGKVLWNYTLGEPNRFMDYIDADSDKIVALYHHPNLSTKTVKILDLSGNLTNEFNDDIPRNNKIIDLKIVGNKIVILTSLGLRFYSFSGELEKIVELPDIILRHGNNMLICSDYSIIIRGTKDGNAIFAKIGNKKVSDENDEGKEVVEFSTVEKVTEKIVSASVFPNPTTETLNFSLEHDDNKKIQKCHIEIFSSDGRRVLSSRLKIEDMKIDVHQLTIGTYIYRITLNDKQHVAGQFIKI